MRPLSRGPGASAFRGKILVAASFLVCAACASAPVKSNPGAERAVAGDLDRIFNAQVTDHALWGVEVKSLDTGRIWYARNARTLMMPASNMKIVTLAAAIQTLGWDYRFKTTLEPSGTVEGGTLHGDLIVRGTGDPTINTRDKRADQVFDEWASALRAAGITQIDGKIVGDGSAFDSRGLGQGWAWDYLQDGYAAPVSALELNENTATLTVRAGANPGDAAGLELPPGTGLGLIHRVTTGAPDSRTDIDVGRPPDGAWIDVSGSIAAGAPPFTRQVAVANPALYFAHSLLNALRARGISVQGLPVDLEDRRGTIPVVSAAPRRVLVETQSPPLRDIATVMMKVSQNLYAETLLKTVGAAKAGTGTTDAGRDAAREIFTNWKLPTPYVQADGSGLSRYDYVTAEMLVGLLEHFHTDQVFVATLPIAGKDGTISTRMRATRAEANALAKTGSISNVRALSGYVKTRDGETLAFSILANNFIVPAATINWMTDLAVETLANYSRR